MERGKKFPSFFCVGLIIIVRAALYCGYTGQVLHPVDVIWLGSDDATEPNLAHGQVCEIVQKEIGVLRNPVVREKA